jgi:glycosyltransferase involved in cell wall biosynthesis
MFLFVFDLMSVMKRKNPLGLVEAYTRAFSTGDGTQLVIKSMNGDKRPDDLATLVAAAAGRPDITIIDAYYSRLETSTLISLADCYVSLHRSEGLGLTLCEAMSHAVPIIATNYSGPTDYLNEDNSCLIPWDRVPVGEGAGGYSPSATWAEPRVAEAVEAMRRVHSDPQAARAMAARGRREILGAFTPGASGTIMRSRLEEIWSLNSGN